MIPILGMVIGILAGLDTVFGGAVADMQKRFDIRVFITGFIGNLLLALLLTFIGEKLGLSLYLVPMFAFGVRLFENFAILRRLFFSKFMKKDVRKK